MTMPTHHFMCTMTHLLYLLQMKHAKTLHFCQSICHRAPPLTTIWPSRAHPLNTMKLALIYTQTWLISAQSKSQKHLHIIHSEIGLPKHYAPNHLIPKGKMRLAAVKAKKISSKKDVLIVKFIFPSSLENVQIQLFCTSLEPKTKQGQGADLSILTALKITKPGAKSLFDLGVRCKPRSVT